MKYGGSTAQEQAQQWTAMWCTTTWKIKAKVLGTTDLWLVQRGQIVV